MVQKLCETAKEILKNEPNTVQVRSPVAKRGHQQVLWLYND